VQPLKSNGTSEEPSIEHFRQIKAQYPSAVALSRTHAPHPDHHEADTKKEAQEIQNRDRRKHNKPLFIYETCLTSTTIEIEYRCSEAPTSQIPYLGALLFDAVQSSQQWIWERSLGGLTTDCLNVLVPENRSQDISITLSVGHMRGLGLIRRFQLTPI